MCSFNFRVIKRFAVRSFFYLGSTFALSIVSSSLYLYFAALPDLTFIGPVNLTDGIGSQAYDHFRLLAPHAEVNLLSSKCQGTDLRFNEWLELWNPIKPLGRIVVIEEPLQRRQFALSSELFSLNSRPSHLLNYLPLWMRKANQQILIAYSMFESDRIPPMWVEQINRYYDAVAVPDTYLVSAYEESGVIKPIFVLPLGVKYPSTPMILRTRPNQPFLFGNLSKTEERKNTFKMIEGFHLAFGSDPNVQLYVNSREKDQSEYEKIRHFLSTHPEIKNITYTNQRLSTADYQKNLNSFDCYVSISRGEGFSITPREAMERGIPLILSDSTAQKTIATSGLVRVIPCPIEAPAYYPFSSTPIGYNNDCTLKEVVLAYRDLYENYSSYLAKQNQMHQWAKAYSYTSLLPRYYNLFVKPQKLILGDRNEVTDTYLMTSSAQLYAKYLLLEGSSKTQ